MNEKKMTFEGFKVTLAWLGLVGAVVLLAALLFGLWRLWLYLSALPAANLAGWLLVLGLGMPLVFLTGFYFGKVEVKGHLGGFDRALDKVLPVVEKTVAVRDNSRIAVHQATRPAPAVDQTLPALEWRNFQRGVLPYKEEDIIDLD